MTTPTDPDPINRIVYLIAAQDISAAQNVIFGANTVDGYAFTQDDANRILAAAESQAADHYVSIRDTLRANSKLSLS